MEMKKADDTDPYRKKRILRRRLGGVRTNTILYFEKVGAERIPQKSIKIMRSAYKKTMLEYWWSLDPKYAERAQHMSKYVKSPDPDTEPHVSLKK